LNDWVKRYGMRSKMPRSQKRPQDFTPAEKFKAVLEFESTPEEKHGEFLRSNGLRSEHIEAWKQAMEKSLESPSKKSGKNTSENIEEKQKIKELERELNQKNKIIAETTALLVLKKKADSIWGTGEDE
jgi:transposase